MNLAANQRATELTVGSYRLHHVIAEGDVATVYDAAHLVLPRRAAIKLLRPEVMASPQAAQRLAREGCVLEAFAHPGTARVFDTGVLADGRPWLALELVGGEPLTARFARAGGLPVVDVIDLMTALVDLLAAAHRSGIVHRDLGPGHVLVGGGGPRGVRVIGWGLARQPGGALDLLGDRRADVYAVGAMAYQAATGAPPFVAVPPVARVISQFHATPPPVRERRPELPPAIAALIEAMLAGEPAARPSAAEVAAELARLDSPYAEVELEVAVEAVAAADAADAADRAATLADDLDDPAIVEAPPAVKPQSAADRDWEQLMALASGRRRWTDSRRLPRMSSCRDDHPTRGK